LRVDRRFDQPLPVLICHRLILSRLLRPLSYQVLANFVGVADRFFEREAILTPIAMLNRGRRAANIAMLARHRVNLPKVFDPCQVPLGSSRYPLGVPQQDRNPIDIQLC
jgi:hypothetical protein